jgi:hypothetical protein
MVAGSARPSCEAEGPTGSWPLQRPRGHDLQSISSTHPLAEREEVLTITARMVPSAPSIGARAGTTLP